MTHLTDEMRYKLLKLLESDPNISQRQLADVLGISLGKVNYCLKALMTKGLIKAKNFRNSQNKLGYVYMLTARGLEDKARVTVRFLKYKMEEYEELEREITQLRREAAEHEEIASKGVSGVSKK